MCRHCVKYGDGTKWYLNPKNYSDEMLHGELANEKVEDTMVASLLGIKGTMQEVMMTANRFKIEVGLGENIDLMFQDLNDDLARIVREGAGDLLDKLHAGQVVPLEDAEKIIDLTKGDIYLEPCICRKYYGGKERMTCMFFPPVSEGMQKNLPWFGGKMISKEEAKKVLRELDKEGIFHGVFWLPAPIPGCICNCEYPYCITLRGRLHYNVIDVYRKGEYVSFVEPNKCNGCGGRPLCQPKCSFGAIKYSPTGGKVQINQMQCWGCGVCRQACPTSAIRLIPREEIPQLKDDW